MFRFENLLFCLSFNIFLLRLIIKTGDDTQNLRRFCLLELLDHLLTACFRRIYFICFFVIFFILLFLVFLELHHGISNVRGSSQWFWSRTQYNILFLFLLIWIILYRFDIFFSSCVWLCLLMCWFKQVWHSLFNFIVLHNMFFCLFEVNFSYNHFLNLDFSFN